MSTGGLIEYPNSETVRLTAEGSRVAPNAPAMTRDEDLHALIYGIMGGPEQKILAQLIASYPSTLSREELMTNSGYRTRRARDFRRR